MRLATLAACCAAACSGCLLHGRATVRPRAASRLMMTAASADLELEMAWCARIVREAADMLVEADADAAVQLLEFEMTQERLGMGPAEGCVGGRTWLCHVDAHVVSLALDSTAKVSSLAVPQLAPCAALARAWRLWAARYTPA